MLGNLGVDMGGAILMFIDEIISKVIDIDVDYVVDDVPAEGIAKMSGEELSHFINMECRKLESEDDEDEDDEEDS